MKQILFLILIISVGCKNQIPMTRDITKSNQIDHSNKHFGLYFEKIFADSITIIYDGKIIFKNYVKTIAGIEAAKEFCKIDSIRSGQDIQVIVGGQKYRFKPLEGYQFYYFTKFNKKIGITYSNVSREYY